MLEGRKFFEKKKKKKSDKSGGKGELKKINFKLCFLKL
jgi:hypothetical protein